MIYMYDNVLNIAKAADFFERTMNELVHDILLKNLSNSTD